MKRTSEKTELEMIRQEQAKNNSAYLLTTSYKVIDYLGRCIKAFRTEVDADHELQLHLNLPDFYVHWFLTLGPDLIQFGGVNKNLDKVNVVQHYSQTNVSYVIAKKNSDNKGAFGFVLDKVKSDC